MDFAIGQKGEMMGDLKPCPFCGRIPDIEDCGEHRWFIRCKCGTAQDKLFFQKCDAVKAWNKRKELRVKDTNVPITDTISRQAAIDAMSESLKRVFPEHRQIAEKCLNALPSAQPEIIHCKDCKHYEFTDNRAFGFPAKWCEWSGFEDMDDDDYCSRGERKENAAD